jgi:hypothetical protein
LFAAYDIDDHGGVKEWSEVAAVALRIATAAKRRGLYVAAVRTGGGHGIHLLIRWDKAQAARDVRALKATILEDEGLADGADGIEIEVFPKQDDVAPGAFGNLLGLPFARASKPLDAAMHPIDAPLLWPSSTSVPPAPEPEPEPDEFEPNALSQTCPVNVQLLREALTYIPAKRYPVWTKIGHAIKHDLGDGGFPLWDEWSQSCP